MGKARLQGGIPTLGADGRPAEGGAVPAANPDGTSYVGKTPDAINQPPPTILIDDAHRAGPFVHACTFRNDHHYLAADYRAIRAPST